MIYARQISRQKVKEFCETYPVFIHVHILYIKYIYEIFTGFIRKIV